MFSRVTQVFSHPTAIVAPRSRAGAATSRAVQIAGGDLSCGSRREHARQHCWQGHGRVWPCGGAEYPTSAGESTAAGGGGGADCQ